MKLKNECVRDVLLDIEENLNLHQIISSVSINKRLKNYSHDDIYYTCRKLEEAGFLKVDYTLSGTANIIEMTYYGHQFLDNIRDSKVWSQTKSVLSKFESVSIDIISSTAFKVITSMLAI